MIEGLKDSYRDISDEKLISRYLDKCNYMEEVRVIMESEIHKRNLEERVLKEENNLKLKQEDRVKSKKTILNKLQMMGSKVVEIFKLMKESEIVYGVFLSLLNLIISYSVFAILAVIAITIKSIQLIIAFITLGLVIPIDNLVDVLLNPQITAILYLFLIMGTIVISKDIRRQKKSLLTYIFISVLSFLFYSPLANKLLKFSIEFFN